MLLLRVWEELGGVVGFNGALLVGKYSLRLAAGTDLVPASLEVAARVKEVQSGAYECLVTAAREGAAITTATESFTLLLPSEITNEVAREAIRALIPTLPLATSLGVLTEEECRIRFPHAAGFLARRTLERRLEARLKDLRPGVLAELRGSGLSFDQNITTVFDGYLPITVSLYLLPSIALVPGSTHAEWSAKLAAAKAKTGPFLVALRQGKEMVEQLLPNITVSVGHPKKYTTIQPAIAA